MGDEVELGQRAWENVVSILGKPGHCKYVDKAAQSAVKAALKGANFDTRPIRDFAGDKAERVCRGMTPEGRTLLIIVGAVGVTVYTVMNYEQVEAQIVDAIKKAKVPIKIPIPKEYGSLRAIVSLDAARVEHQIRAGDVRIKSFFEQSYSGGNQQLGIGLSGPLGNGQNTNGSWSLRGTSDLNRNHGVTFELKFSW